MQSHEQPPHPPSLDDLADTVAATTNTLVGAANRQRRDRDSDGLDAAATLLAAIDRLTAAVITILQTTGHHQVIIGHGLTRDSWLRAIARRTGADAGMLLAAAERLADMPAVTAWFHEGTLSWGAVRGIVAATRTLTAAQRAWIDHTLAEHGADVARLDQDQITAAVDGLANQARPDLHRDRDTTALARRWLTIQPRLDGTADIHGTLDPETAAAALAAFRDPTPLTDHPDDGHHPDGHGDGDSSDGDRVRAAKRQANVDTFRNLCRQRTTHHHTAADDDPADADPGATAAAADAGVPAGTAGAAGVGCPRCGSAPSTARPAFLVVADLAALDPDTPTGSATARLHWATNRPPVELTPAAARRLACDATLRAVITDHTTVLGVTAAHPRVSATLRAALVVRDGGCRFPGCTRPADVCDTHHLIPVVAGGTTDLSNLALICRDHHHAIHDSAWQAVLHGDAALTFTRHGATVTSQPRARQHPTPAQPPPTGRPPRRRHTTRPTDTDPGGPGGPEPHDAGRPDPADALLPF